jgi:hypothetical protein
LEVFRTSVSRGSGLAFFFPFSQVVILSSRADSAGLGMISTGDQFGGNGDGDLGWCFTPKIELLYKIHGK